MLQWHEGFTNTQIAAISWAVTWTVLRMVELCYLRHCKCDRQKYVWYT